MVLDIVENLNYLFGFTTMCLLGVVGDFLFFSASLIAPEQPQIRNIKLRNKPFFNI